jgi:hypothetical protein
MHPFDLLWGGKESGRRYVGKKGYMENRGCGECMYV